MFKIGNDLSISTGGGEVKAKVLGWKGGKKGYLIVAPIDGSRDISHDKNGSRYVVRFMDAGQLFGMEAELSGKIPHSNALLLSFLEGKVITKNIRSSKRFNCSSPAVLRYTSITSARVEEQGLVHNINRNGMLILSIQKVESKYVQASFNLGHIGEVRSAYISVSHSRSYGNCYGYAGPFVDLVDEDVAKIERYTTFCEDWLSIENAPLFSG